MQIRLIRPEGAHKQQALAFRQSFFDAGETVIHGSELLDRAENYESWLLNVTANTAPESFLYSSVPSGMTLTGLMQ